MSVDWLMSPGMVLFGGAVLAYYLTGRNRIILLSLPLLCLAMIWLGEDSVVVGLMGYELILVQKSSLGLLFATTFAVMALGGLWFAFKQASRSELAAAQLYAGSSIGLVLCGDFITFFIFWELMAIGSTWILFSTSTATSSNNAAFNAAMRYALIHLLSGMLLLWGIVGLIEQSGDASLRLLGLSSIYEWLILIGFLINAGAPRYRLGLPTHIPKGASVAVSFYRHLPPNRQSSPCWSYLLARRF